MWKVSSAMFCYMLKILYFSYGSQEFAKICKNLQRILFFSFFGPLTSLIKTHKYTFENIIKFADEQDFGYF